MKSRRAKAPITSQPTAHAIVRAWDRSGGREQHVAAKCHGTQATHLFLPVTPSEVQTTHHQGREWMLRTCARCRRWSPGRFSANVLPFGVRRPLHQVGRGVGQHVAASGAKLSGIVELPACFGDFVSAVLVCAAIRQVSRDTVAVAEDDHFKSRPGGGANWPTSHSTGRTRGLLASYARHSGGPWPGFGLPALAATYDHRGLGVAVEIGGRFACVGAALEGEQEPA